MNNISLDAINQLREGIEKDINSGAIKLNAHLDWEDGTKNNVVIRDFSPIVIDEPELLGGTNKGPNPVEYLLSGAAACFSISFEIFASQQGIKLEKVSTDIEADVDFAVFFGIKDGERGITNPTIKLHVVSSAPIEKIKEIANLALSASVVLNSLKEKVKLIVFTA
jgi:uncharacterized OsmC-like protein